MKTLQNEIIQMTKPTSKNLSAVASRKAINAVKAKLASMSRKRDAERQARAELKVEKKANAVAKFRKGPGSLKSLKGNVPLIKKPKGKK